MVPVTGARTERVPLVAMRVTGPVAVMGAAAEVERLLLAVMEADVAALMGAWRVASVPAAMVTAPVLAVTAALTATMVVAVRETLLAVMVPDVARGPVVFRVMSPAVERRGPVTMRPRVSVKEILPGAVVAPRVAMALLPVASMLAAEVTRVLAVMRPPLRSAKAPVAIRVTALAVRLPGSSARAPATLSCRVEVVAAAAFTAPVTVRSWPFWRAKLVPKPKSPSLAMALGVAVSAVSPAMTPVRVPAVMGPDFWVRLPAVMATVPAPAFRAPVRVRGCAPSLRRKSPDVTV